MTLIARFMFESAPLFVGDLLLSAERKSPDRVDIPAALDINAKLPAEALRSITGLRQKLNILDDGLIVAWAGQMIQARHILQRIAEVVRDGANWQDVNSLIASLPIEDRNDVSLLGTIVRRITEPKAGFHIQNFGYSFCKRFYDGVEISAAGSGMNDLFEIAPQLLVHANISSEHDTEVRAMRLGMVASAALVGHETSTGQNLLNWWGGAIEIAILDGGRFRKVDKILHTRWRARKQSDESYQISLVPKFIKYDYFEDVLIAQTLELELREEGGEARGKLIEHSYRAYTPLLKGPREYDWRSVSASNFEHTTLCAYLMIEGAEARPSLVYVHHDASGDTPLRIEKVTGQVVLGFRGDLVTSLLTQVSDFTGMPAVFSRIGS